MARAATPPFQIALAAAAAILTLSMPVQAASDLFHESLGERFRASGEAPEKITPKAHTDALHRWNQIAIDASGLDHTPVAAGGTRIFGEQLGPGRSSRAMAIVHVAMADVVSVETGRFASFTGLNFREKHVSREIAISQAAHDTLVALYPSQAASFDTFLNEDLLRIRGGKLERKNGEELGRRAAAAILAARANDGVTTAEPKVDIDHLTSNLAGRWRKDPISRIPLAMGGHWGECVPFVLEAANQFRIPPPPAINSAAYTEAFNEVKNLGGDGVNTPTQRSAEQTFIGVYWAYDGNPEPVRAAAAL